jgi:c(7)-type cytochrome triheme protein
VRTCRIHCGLKTEPCAKRRKPPYAADKQKVISAKVFLWALAVLPGVPVPALLAQEKKAPEKMTFSTNGNRLGNVTFNHSAHLKRMKGECLACHPKLFQEDAKASLNYKAGIHKTAELEQTACGSCHRPGGTAFETKGNCGKCHTRG